MNDDQKKRLEEAKAKQAEREAEAKSTTQSMAMLQEFRFIAPSLEDALKKLVNQFEVKNWEIDIDPLTQKLSEIEAFIPVINQLHDEIKALPDKLPKPLKEVKLDNLSDLTALIKTDRAEVRKLIESNKIKPDVFKNVVDAVNNLSRKVDELTADPKQAPDKFTPVRRVREVLPGKFIYDDSTWSSSPGGGTGTSSSGGGDGTIIDGVDSSIKATVFDYANANPLAVVLRDTSGDYVSVGGGTQYTEDAAAAANPVGTAVNLVRADTPATLVSTDGDNVAQRGTNYGAAYTQIVTSSGSFVDTFGGGTQYTEGDTDATITGTAMMMEGATNTLVAAQGTAADGLLVNLGTNNDVTITGTVAVTQSGTWDEVGINDSGNSITVDNPQLSVVGGGTEATALRVTIANDSTGVLSVDDNGGSLTVDNSGTFAVQVDGAALTALQLIDDPVATLGTTTYTEATTKGNIIGAVRRDADTTLVDTTNEVAPLQVDARGALKVEAFSGETLPVSLTSTTITGTVAVTQSGTWDEIGINDSGNSITVDNGGTFAVQAAQSGTWTVQPGNTANTTAWLVSQQPATAGGLSTMMASSADGSTALTSTAQAIKASAGQLFGWYIFNPNSVVCYVNIYNVASGSVTVGTTNPLTMLAIPPSSAANAFTDSGITFSTAISVAAVMTTAGGTTAPTTALEANFYYK